MAFRGEKVTLRRPTCSACAAPGHRKQDNPAERRLGAGEPVPGVRQPVTLATIRNVVAPLSL